jgi:hypothetical protein
LENFVIPVKVIQLILLISGKEIHQILHITKLNPPRKNQTLAMCFFCWGEVSQLGDFFSQKMKRKRKFCDFWG